MASVSTAAGQVPEEPLQGVGDVVPDCGWRAPGGMAQAMTAPSVGNTDWVPRPAPWGH